METNGEEIVKIDSVVYEHELVTQSCLLFRPYHTKVSDESAISKAHKCRICALSDLSAMRFSVTHKCRL